MFVLQLITLDLFKRNILQHLIHKYFFYKILFFQTHFVINFTFSIPFLSRSSNCSFCFSESNIQIISLKRPIPVRSLTYDRTIDAVPYRCKCTGINYNTFVCIPDQINVQEIFLFTCIMTLSKINSNNQLLDRHQFFKVTVYSSNQKIQKSLHVMLQWLYRVVIRRKTL